jgi:hypothetical protein
MKMIDGGIATGEPSVGEMTALQRIISNIKYRLIRFRRKLPYLVWWNDELDVGVTLSQDKLDPDAENPFRQLYSGAFAEIEKKFGEMGIGFDKGMGCEGRAWEWDWSLKGPISVRFHGRSTHPERRMERPKPHLIVRNPKAMVGS